MEDADFSGWATKAGLKCTDGRTIMKDAFKHQDKVTVPLVWQHGHNDPTNVLGHAVLENRDEGVYTYAFFNDTPHGQAAKKLVQHKDISFLSIYANQLVEKAKQVFHGVIREVSLVLAGANPEAKIDYVAVQHSDGSYTDLEDEAVIYTGLEIQHEDLEHAESDTVKDVYDSLTEEQKEVVHYMIGAALEADTAEHSDKDKSGDSDKDKDREGDLTHQDKDKEGTDMTHNVFDRTDKDKKEAGHVLTHDAMRGIFEEAQTLGSLNKAVENYVLKHGIEDIEALFPEAKDVDGGAPTWVTRRMEWVAGVLNGTRKSPFSRIKSRTADLTHEEARAKGYIKGNFKKEQWFTHAKRETTPQTIYKKQKLDRDDILDISDFDVVAWIKAEMRVMLEEELARAILFGDGRPTEDPANPGEPNPDKIREDHIRPIATDSEVYVTTVNVELDDANNNTYGEGLVEAVLMSRRFYRGSGAPTFYTTEETLTRMLLAKDGMNRRLYKTEDELRTALRVSAIVPVEAMESQGDLVGVIVNLSDYVVGADRGGNVSLFDDFDIDYNQYKYLIETRCSGALVKVKSALVVRRRAVADAPVEPTEPTFNEATGVVTIPTTANVTYTNADTGAALVAGAQPALAEGDTLNVEAVPAAGYYVAPGAESYWSFYNTPAG